MDEDCLLCTVQGILRFTLDELCTIEELYIVELLSHVNYRCC
jgi:hypothetical protein